MNAILEMRNIVKHFPGTIASDQVTLTVNEGEIHALLGENGAGKTTLMNILYGLCRADSGEIFFKGQRVKINSPEDAIALGIGMVHQHFMLVPALTVAENIILGTRVNRELFLDLTRTEKQIKELSNRYGLKVDPGSRVWQLSVGEQQRVEILKALYRRAELLILDEPTAVLTPQETEDLFNILRSFVAEGRTVIIISHKLKEIMSISQRVTVLRRGRVVGTVNTATTSAQELARLMVGKELSRFPTREPFNGPQEEILRVENLEVTGDRGLPVVKGISFKIMAREVLGIAGVEGNGQAEMVEAISGIRRIKHGRFFLKGREVTGFHAGRLVAAGMAHIPQDRRGRGLVMEMSIAENLIFRNLKKYCQHGFLDYPRIYQYAAEMINRFEIKTPGIKANVRLLSGGNQQKVVLARELDGQPPLILAAHPTRGLDIGATDFVHQQILAARKAGSAVLLVSADLDEIFALSDRIGVIYEGHLVGIVRPDQVTLEEIGLMMAGNKSLGEAG